LKTPQQIAQAVKIGMMQRRIDLMVLRELEHLRKINPMKSETELMPLAMLRVAGDFNWPLSGTETF